MKIKKQTTYKLATAGILLAVIIVMQLIKNISAFISGPVINTAMAIAAIELGTGYGIAFSVIVPVLSIVVAPASAMTMLTTATYGATLPIIIAGNIILVMLAKTGSKKKIYFFLAFIVAGAVIKWLFMWGCSDLIIKPLFSESLGDLNNVLNKIFSTLQLYSGLLSAVLIIPVKTALNKAIKK